MIHKMSFDYIQLQLSRILLRYKASWLELANQDQSEESKNKIFWNLSIIVNKRHDWVQMAPRYAIIVCNERRTRRFFSRFRLGSHHDKNLNNLHNN